jgi:uncharacterized protein YhdP
MRLSSPIAKKYGLGLGGFLVLSLVFAVTAHRHLDKLLKPYHGRITQEVYEQTGQKVSFGKIGLSLGWHGPEITLHNLKVGKGEATVSSVRLSLNVSHMIATGSLIFDRIQIEGLALNQDIFSETSSRRKPLAVNAILASDFVRGIELVSLEQTTFSPTAAVTIAIDELQIKPALAASQRVYLLEVSDVSLTAPKMFQQPLKVGKFEAAARFEDKGKVLVLSKLAVENEDARISSLGRIRLTTDLVLDAEVEIKKFRDLSKITKYFPRTLPTSAYRWLTDAFKQGGTVQGRARWHGPLDAFDESLAVDLDVKDGSLKFDSEWPLLTDINAEVKIRGRDITIIPHRATSEQVQLESGLVQILDIGLEKPLLKIGFFASAQATEALEYLDGTPLRSDVPGFAKKASFDGTVMANLNIAFDLSGTEPAQVQGEVATEGSSVLLKKYNLAASEVYGHVNFSEKGIGSGNFMATAWSKPVQVSLERAPDGQTVIVNFSGEASLDGIKRGFPKLPLDFVKGQTPVAGNIAFAPDENVEMRISSNLEGATLDLPNPLTKEDPQSILPAHLTISFENDGDPESAQISVANVLLASWTNDENGSAAKIHLTRLEIPTATSEERSKLDPRDLPSLEIVCEQLTVGKSYLGRLDLVAVRSDEGLILERFSLATVAKEVLVTKGEWLVHGNRQSTAIEGKVALTNLRTALFELGNTRGGINNTTGEIDFDFAWNESPLNFEISKLNGSTKYELRNGGIVSSSIGGRFLNLINLNLKNMFSDEIPFNAIRGALAVKNGIATADDFVIDLGAYAVNVAGQIDLPRNDLNIEMQVKSSLTVLPVAQAKKLGNVIGTAVEMANSVLTLPVSQFSTFKYSVIGPVDSPEVALQEYGKIPMWIRL